MLIYLYITYKNASLLVSNLIDLFYVFGQRTKHFCMVLVHKTSEIFVEISTFDEEFVGVERVA